MISYVSLDVQLIFMLQNLSWILEPRKLSSWASVTVSRDIDSSSLNQWKLSLEEMLPLMSLQCWSSQILKRMGKHWRSQCRWSLRLQQRLFRQTTILKKFQLTALKKTLKRVQMKMKIQRPHNSQNPLQSEKEKRVTIQPGWMTDMMAYAQCSLYFQRSRAECRKC